MNYVYKMFEVEALALILFNAIVTFLECRESMAPITFPALKKRRTRRRTSAVAEAYLSYSRTNGIMVHVRG